MESDSRKSDQIAIFITDEETQVPPVNPQYQHYFGFIYLISVLFTGILLFLSPMFQDEKNSPFKTHGGFFMIMMIASSSFAVLASLILIFTSYFLQSLMRDLHYTILKSIGSLSAVLAPFWLVTGAFVPQHLNWIVYTVICVFFIVILVGYYPVWKLVCDDKMNEIPIHRALLFLAPVQPVSNVLVLFIPHNLHWIKNLIIGITLAIVVIAGSITYVRVRLNDRKKQSMEQVGHSGLTVLGNNGSESVKI